ncbi:hypothetical protein B1222_01705 [Paenibacillus larvae subsp. pulvifaciens]|nr:hypothetical protein B1222_01705 [Paenibacillus larvae subsp. pulvifaciens]
MLRILRLLCFFIAFLGPSLYIAITTFHQEMIPSELLVNLMAQREDVPFPAFFEAIIMEVIVSITAISNLVFPSINMAIPIRILRFPLMILAASFGLLGIFTGFIALLLHLCSLRSFGIPYMSPFVPLIPSDLKDTFIRTPRWAMLTRPRLTSQNNIVRGQTPKPKPPQEGD